MPSYYSFDFSLPSFLCSSEFRRLHFSVQGSSSPISTSSESWELRQKQERQRRQVWQEREERALRKDKEEGDDGSKTFLFLKGRNKE